MIRVLAAAARSTKSAADGTPVSYTHLDVYKRQEESHNLFASVGFKKAGRWGTLTPKKPEEVKDRLPSYIPVYNRLYQDLIDGVYEKDSLLPSENVLAAAYKVSRNTLRQALTILTQDGFIYKRQGKGTFVSYDCHREERKNLYNFLRECSKEPITRVTMDSVSYTHLDVYKRQAKRPV